DLRRVRDEEALAEALADVVREGGRRVDVSDITWDLAEHGRVEDRERASVAPRARAREGEIRELGLGTGARETLRRVRREHVLGDVEHRRCAAPVGERRNVPGFFRAKPRPRRHGAEGIAPSAPRARSGARDGSDYKERAVQCLTEDETSA